MLLTSVRGQQVARKQELLQCLLVDKSRQESYLYLTSDLSLFVFAGTDDISGIQCIFCRYEVSSSL